MKICASLNHRKKLKTEPRRIIPQKPTENLELLIFDMKYKTVVRDNGNL